ncbi:hypothetical protein AVEN_40807-1 [Araneus ventricosus]|uniref:Uncharacterized protein n=1 Tax=Araneus ventricosus TaxID=182803 RepID=A0A4Y2CE76_ARAVE|nr:hypothetical protein AVEN_40807-1 [Araneus ventricosus]
MHFLAGGYCLRLLLWCHPKTVVYKETDDNLALEGSHKVPSLTNELWVNLKLMLNTVDNVQMHKSRIPNEVFVKLPEVSLPEFNGNIDNSTLNETQNLFHLRSVLKGDAKLVETQEDTFNSLMKGKHNRLLCRNQNVSQNIKSAPNADMTPTLQTGETPPLSHPVTPDLSTSAVGGELTLHTLSSTNKIKNTVLLSTAVVWVYSPRRSSYVESCKNLNTNQILNRQARRIQAIPSATKRFSRVACIARFHGD